MTRCCSLPELSKLIQGGPGFRLYKYTVDNVATYFPLEKFGPETYRRSVYLQAARSIRPELLAEYDCRTLRYPNRSEW